MLDLLVKNARLDDYQASVDIGIVGEQITLLEADITAPARVVLDAENQFVCAGFYETHIHLDKACILSRCPVQAGGKEEASQLTKEAKKDFTEQDVFARASRVIEMAIKKGTMGLRTFVETDPRAGLRSLAALKRVREVYAPAIDIELCAFAQDGLTQEMATYELLRQALQQGADLVGGCPYTDPDRHVELIFDLAEEFEVNVDFHLDFDLNPAQSGIPKIVEQTKQRGYQGRVSIGHVNKLSAMPPAQRAGLVQLLLEAEIALTVLPATDLLMMGQEHTHLIPRGVVNAHELQAQGLLTTISSNNILNAFTPYGDASLVRMANLYANVAQLATDDEIRATYEMVTTNAARLLARQARLQVGGPATFVLLEASSATEAIRTIAQPLLGYKNGRPTFTNPKAVLYPAV
ncbi:amidohydrolase family protein (plasmid) [Hymenobacter sp. NBH84]|uniref:amidohydrolase family protein n=1 Tax=Hymenobacter sp. NBH84 TaxID=2596915 RepID=UPI00162A0C3F|nr:amidohydrolase family protein [Hymenobacter sp. NBH84]QNE41921.1 amidohydrolase family protein [Hymenobacter sp. NBH84]